MLLSFLSHCLDRSSLLLAASEIDRVLPLGGMVALSDFAPDRPTRRPWKHRDGITTFKLPDAGATIFLATGMYREIGRLTYDHDAHGRLDAATPGERRAVVCLLRKESMYLCE